jgi:general nucleoside transport system permease protein
VSTSTETGTGGPAPASKTDSTQARRSALSNKRYRLMIIVALGLVALSAVRTFSGAGDLTSGGTIGAALSLAVPIGMAGLGGLWAERAGIVNIGLEGMMILGSFGAGWIGWQHGPWLGVLAAVLFGAVGGLVHAVATITFGVDHIVSGVAINILGLGVTQFLASVLLEGTPGGGESQSPRIPEMPSPSIPGFSDALLPVEKHGWFVISDLAGILRGLTTNVSVLTLVALLLVVGSYYVLWQTPFGLRLRACGEDPYAAESLGVRVYLHKYIAVLVSGGLAGFAGAYLAIVAAGIYREGQTGGRGYIGLAAMIFGNWRPGGLVAGAGLFGYTDAMQLRNAAAVHALLLVIAVILAGVVILSVVRKRFVAAVIAAAFAALAVVWYAQTDVLPDQITFMTPYITTLLVLALASQRLRMPKADGLIYRRGGSR